MLCISFAIQAQVSVKGIVLDKDTKEPLIGVTVYEPSSKKSAITDLDGSFTLKLPSLDNRKIEFTYIGYLKMEVPVTDNMRTVLMAPDAVVLGDVIVTGSIGIQRKTPVAMSTIEPQDIEYKLSTKEFPEILNTTPGVYATRDGGGFGDSRINVRGFESQNTAVLINGIPMNDMEWGGVYWSNWGALNDVTRSLQIQRGLGASKVSAPSVGGSIAVLTKTTEAKKGGSVYYGMGPDGYNKISANFSSGMTDNGWAISALGAKTWGDGYILGTEFESYTYFLNISKKINDQHQLAFTGLGAWQEHNQRSKYDKMLITEWQKQRDLYQFNPTYGFDNDGQRKTANFNHYHKPHLSLNHYWTIDDKSSLSSSLYLSIGQGGGYAWRGSSYTSLYGVDSNTGILNTAYRGIDGYMDYGKLQRENAANPNGSVAAITDSRNNHTWIGLLSTYTKKINNIDFYGGLDLRYYNGFHDGVIVDLMGGKYFIDPARAGVKYSQNAGNPSWVNEKLDVGDVVYRDYNGYIVQEGVFANAEYTKDKLNLTIGGAISNSSYWKVDRLYYDNEKSDVGNFLGFTAKGGANYNLTENHNVFANLGYISRAPFMSGGYLVSIATSNATNPNAVNEKLFSFELGYGYRSSILAAKVNVYSTNWRDKTMVQRLGNGEGTINMEGVNALHQGIEAEFTLKPVKNFEVKGMASIGNWRWTNNVTGYYYNDNGQAVDKSGNVVDPLSPDHAKAQINMKGVKVGDAAQLQLYLGADYRFLKDFSVGLDYLHQANNYAGYDLPKANANSVYTIHTPWKIPDAGTLDLNARYRFKIGDLDATLSGNINNVLNQVYIADAKDLKVTNETPSTWQDVAVMYGFGRTFSVAIRVKF